MYTCPTHYLYLFYFFPSLFSHPPVSSPIPIKYIFFSFTHHLVSSSSLLPHSKYNSSSSPKRQEERNILHTQKMRKRSRSYRRRISQQKKKPAATVGLCVYVGIENYTFDLEFCSLFGWLEVGGNEKKEEPLLRTTITCTVQFFFWASCN